MKKGMYNDEKGQFKGDYMLEDVLKAQRDLLKLKQAEVAEYVGVTTQTYMKWENGKNEPKASHIKKLAEILKVSEKEICQGKLNKKMSLERFIVQLSQIDASTGLEALRIWEQVPDHAKFLSSLVEGEIPKEKEILFDAYR